MHFPSDIDEIVFLLNVIVEHFNVSPQYKKKSNQQLLTERADGHDVYVYLKYEKLQTCGLSENGAIETYTTNSQIRVNAQSCLRLLLLRPRSFRWSKTIIVRRTRLVCPRSLC
jgi:hypothetical protein